MCVTSPFEVAEKPSYNCNSNKLGKNIIKEEGKRDIFRQKSLAKFDVGIDNG